jgi:hypothetical protein
MTDAVPPGARCTQDGCEREAVDPNHPAGFCPEHHPTVEGDGGETPDVNQQSGGEDRSVLVNENPTETHGAKGEEAGPNPHPSDDMTQSTDSHNNWATADFQTITSDTYPPTQLEREQWMGRLAGEKMPFAPWGDQDHPEADEDTDARYKWGLTENYVDGDTVALAEDDPRLDGRVFLQQDADPFAFVDGDDVRCPETDAVHPAFVDILQALGATYADVSTSGAGVHAYYEGDLPNDQGQAVFEIDTEPWGANEDPPTVEIYANTHVCVTTGDHVAGTPEDVHQWDADAVEQILEDFDALKDTDPVEHDTDRDLDLDDHQPEATAPDETTTDARDIALAVDRLTPRNLPLRSRQVDTDGTGWEKWDPSTYRTSSGNDSLHRPPGEPVFHDFKHGESFGVLSLFAAEQGIISKPWDRLAGTDWWDAVDAAREKGAPIPEYTDTRGDEDAEPVAPLALAKLDAVADHERDRLARKLGVTIPTTDDAREDLRDTLFREFRAENTTVVDAPTALGKSYTVATEPWRRRTSTTGDAPVVHLHATRDARDEAADASAGAGVDYAVLRGRKETCSLARGDHDPVDDPDAEDAPDQIVTIDGQPASDWFDEMCDRRGLPFSTAHALAHDRNDQDLDDLPCSEDGECLAQRQWNGLPRTDDGDPAKDVIHATHEFAYVPSLRQHTNVVLDEQPDYTQDFTQAGTVEAETARVRSMVSAYLREIDAPVSTWEAFVQLARFDSAGDSDASREQDALDDAIGTEPPTEWYVDDSDAHALAPDLTRAIWRALRWEDADANGRRSTKVVHEPPRFDDGDDRPSRTYLSVVVDDQNNVRTVRSTPDFSQARAVVGLDAHPSMPLWHSNAHPNMTRDAVLDSVERRLWRRYERGLTVVQVGDATRPRSGSKAREWMNEDRVRTVVDRLRDHYGDAFNTAITTSQVETAVREILRECDGAVDDENTMHYGEEKSRNDFADEAAGLLYGCMDPGDDMILDMLAELGLDAHPATAETDDGDMVREKGRTFDGDDADTAEAVLASVRENHVAQAAGRYARNPDDPDSQAVVFTMTDAHPPGFADLQAPGVEWLATDLQREIIDELAARPSATTRELADAVECSKRHVRETLETLEDEGLVDCRDGAGDHGADIYQADADTDAVVSLGLGEITNDPLKDSIRWSLAVSPPGSVTGRVQPGESTTEAVDEATSGGDPPPDRGE